MAKLAINGGKKLYLDFFPSQNTFDIEEQIAVERVIRSNVLTGYRGNYTNNFFGGAEVKSLEKIWSERFLVKNSIACNSATSGLQIACGAIGLSTGDEVIVTPYSMSCSATAPMIYGAVPVFADIEPDYFCLDTEDVKRKITKKTKAIIVVDLFGQPHNYEELKKIAAEYNLKIIEDAAQALGSTYKKKFSGTLGDIGVYSFNQGKHITCGEGGMIVTNDSDLALKCRLIMNHAEAVVNEMNHPPQSLKKLVGFNMRMTEISAAIIKAQLEKLDGIIAIRKTSAKKFSEYLTEIPAISKTKTRKNCTNTYYAQAFLWDKDKADGSHRDIFIRAVKAELMPRENSISQDVPICVGYVKPLYRLPIFDIQKKLCPECEELYNDKLFLNLFIAPKITLLDLAIVKEAFLKCWKYREELKQ